MKTINGICLPDEDTHFEELLGRSPLIDGKATYQLKKYLKARESIRTFCLAVDIGAHVGLWSRVMSLDFLRVIAFEPVARHRECFLRNCADRTNIELLPFAVGDVNGPLQMMEIADNSGNARVSTTTDGERTTCVTLDSYSFPQRIDFLKIDVEGFETKVVVGGEYRIKHDKPTIIIEQKPGNAEQFGFKQFDAFKLLKAWGAIEVATMSGDVILRW